MSQVPCVVTAHGWSFNPSIPEPNRRIYRWRSKFIVPLASKVICVSEFEDQTLSVYTEAIAISSQIATT